MINFDKATNKQLQVIMNYDRNCPKNLLEKVINEMMERNILKSFITYHSKRYFGTVKSREVKLGLEYSDIIQLGYIGIWKALDKFIEGKSSFSSFSELYMKTEWQDHLSRFHSQKRTMERDCVSTDLEINDEGATLDEFLPSYENVEKTVLMKVYFESQLESLTPLQKAAVFGYMKGYEMQEVATMQHVNKRSADRAFRTAIKKMGGEKLSLKNNCGVKRGA